MTSRDAHLSDNTFEEFNAGVVKQVTLHIDPLFAPYDVSVVVDGRVFTYSRWASSNAVLKESWCFFDLYCINLITLVDTLHCMYFYNKNFILRCSVLTIY
jgi:hypothetical protein